MSQILVSVRELEVREGEEEGALDACGPSGHLGTMFTQVHGKS